MELHTAFYTVDFKIIKLDPFIIIFPKIYFKIFYQSFRYRFLNFMTALKSNMVKKLSTCPLAFQRQPLNSILLPLTAICALAKS
jgi:hypothetical protein